jgi:tetratricopeptide (TPR) repeat protein
MKKWLFALVVMFVAVSAAFAGEWEDLINSALKQAPSRQKRKTRSGKRLLREKRERIDQIDRLLPSLIQKGEYSQTESVLKESLKLTVETYGVKDLHVADRFTSLGILYMAAGKQAKAEETFLWALKIGSEVLGRESYQLSNIYRFLAAAYYEQGKYKEAAAVGEELLAIYTGQFGKDDPRTAEAKELLKKIYEKQK